MRLTLPDEPGRSGSGWLDLGALSLGPDEAIAWVEMARGLLLHHVQLDGRGDDARVVACHVLAPTEWNFHPDGAVARALEQLPRLPLERVQRRVDVLMAAYDPCVEFKLEPRSPSEVADA